MRADLLLVAQGLAPSRAAAQRLIERGAVRWRGTNGWAQPRKAGEDLPERCEIEIVDDAELRWVSRAGLKLDAALEHAGLGLRGLCGLDVGQSTGGFTEVLLARGAERVVGVEVGHGQLHARLKGDPRVTVFEGLNARHLSAADLGDAMPREGFGLVVADLSFISLTLVLPALVPLLGAQGELLLLVKPQFELQPAQIGKGGLVKDDTHFASVEQRLRGACADLALEVRDWFPSAVDGGDGNREFFLRAARRAVDRGTT